MLCEVQGGVGTQGPIRLTQLQSCPQPFTKRSRHRSAMKRKCFPPLRGNAAEATANEVKSLQSP